MKVEYYRPEKPVSGPAYGKWFKALATVMTCAVGGYAVSFALRFSFADPGIGMTATLLMVALMFALSYYWFMNSRITIDEKGISQTWVFNRRVEWRDVRGAKMIGIPCVSWLFPPRLVVRTGNAFATFNGGSREVLLEFAKISLAFQMKKP